MTINNEQTSMWSKISIFSDNAEHVQKFVFCKQDIAIEAVLYRYPTFDKRTVLCISTMCGCPIGCRFCGTGDYFVRSLSADEIVSQATTILSNHIGDIDPTKIEKLQIMVMSMGEPLLVRALEPAFKQLHELYPNAQLLVSSSGPKVNLDWFTKLSQQISTIGLQFSVHESTDEKRDQLIPFQQKLTLQEIAEEGSNWYNATGRKPFFNYCAHQDNSTTEDAIRLRALFDPTIWEATVSVVCERDANNTTKTSTTQQELATQFSSLLVEAGFNVRVFDPAGQDTIGGGCGQLWYVQDWMKNNPEYAKPSIGCNKPIIHSPK